MDRLSMLAGHQATAVREEMSKKRRKCSGPAEEAGIQLAAKVRPAPCNPAASGPLRPTELYLCHVSARFMWASSRARFNNLAGSASYADTARPTERAVAK